MMKVTIIPREKAPAPPRHGPAKSTERVAIETMLDALTPGHVVAIKAGSVEEVPRLRSMLTNVIRASDTPLVSWAAGDSIYVAQKDTL